MSPNRRWLVLASGMAGLIAACAFQYGLPFLVPSLRAAGLTLTQASAMVSAPVLGVLCALVLWGVIADRLGERWVLTAGLAGAAVALGVAAAVSADGPRPLLLAPCLFAAGASAACVQVASGRLILGWFPASERGLAMGFRQTGQPLGVGLAALTVPHLAGGTTAVTAAGAVTTASTDGNGATAGPARAMVFLACCCAAAAAVIAAGVRDVHREPVHVTRAARSPYRGSYLWRVHLSGALMVVPQFGVAAFAFDYLVTDQGWRPGAAGSLLAVAQAGGAASRLGAGWWSDRAGSRLGPMRLVCWGTAAVLAVLAATAFGGWTLAVAAVWVASVITVSTNGLSFTAVAERAGQAWAGRALGVHNTGQNITAALTPPLLAALITAAGPAGGNHGYATGFACLVVFPVLAALTVPLAGERVEGTGGSDQSGAPAVAESKPGSH